MTATPAAQAVHTALARLAAGGMVVVIDDEDRENEGDLLVAAEFATAETMAFIVRNSTGIVCAAMSPARTEQLRLPQMVAENSDRHGTAFTVAVDHMSTGTGVSASDRATTVQRLADPSATPEEFRRPGHVFGLRARPAGVLERSGHTEAAVDLTTLAGLSGVGVISEIVDDDGTMRRGESLERFARDNDLPVLAIADLIRYRSATESEIEFVASSKMPTEFGEFRAVVYRQLRCGTEHLALIMGDVAAAGRSPSGALVRVHSECLTGDIIASLRCDCGSQLEQSMRAIADEGCGVVVYLRGQEGRGIGLGHKIRAYDYQERGLDTVDANTVQGLPVDSRRYGVGSQILCDLGISRIRLITNNPDKYRGLSGFGLEIVERVAIPPIATAENVRYLRTKRDRMGHSITGSTQAFG